MVCSKMIRMLTQQTTSFKKKENLYVLQYRPFNNKKLVSLLMLIQHMGLQHSVSIS